MYLNDDFSAKEKLHHYLALETIPAYHFKHLRGFSPYKMGVIKDSIIQL